MDVKTEQTDSKGNATNGASMGTHARPRINPGLKFALEMGPLVAFFFTNWKFGIFPATGVLMVCVVASLAVSYALTKHLPIMPVVTAVAVVFFGALTFFFNNAGIYDPPVYISNIAVRRKYAMKIL